MRASAQSSEISSTRQLGLRANEREEALISRAAEVEKRNRNAFILLAALERADRVLSSQAKADLAVSVPGESGSDDPLLSAIGIGRDLWHDETADEYVANLRANWDDAR